MDQFRTNCNDDTEIQMSSYTYNPDVSKYPFIKVNHSEFLEYEKTIQEFVNLFNKFSKTLFQIYELSLCTRCNGAISYKLYGWY